MRMYDSASQQWIDVADPAQAQAQFLAGTHSFAGDAQVPIETKYGDLLYVPAAQLDKHLAADANITDPARVDQAQLQKEYGGLGGQAIAAGEGIVRGVSMDTSDALAVEGARAFGGDQAAEKVRKHLENEKAANPKTALASEIGGAVLPAVLSAGETAPESIAEVGTELAARAAKPSIIGTIARYTPAGLVDRAGMAATKAAEGVLGARSASSALGRIAQAAATHAIGDAVPGAIYNAAGELDEDYLSGGNHALTAEKTIAALGHGALWGVLLGGGLSGAGAASREVAAPLLRKASPYLDKAAGEQMWKALDPLKKYTNEAEAKAGGSSAIGQTLIDKLGLGERPLTEAAMSPVELAPKIDEAVQRQGSDISTFLRNHGAQDISIPVQKLDDAVESVIAPMRGKALHEGVVASLEDARNSLYRSLGLGEETMGFLARAKNAGLSPEEYAARVASEGGVVPKIRVGFDELLTQRKAIDQMAYVEAKALNPKMRVEQLREMRRNLASLEADAIDEHAKSIGLSQTAKQDYLKLKKDFQRLSIAQDAVNETTARMATNRNLSMSDYLAGVQPAMMALVHGNIPGAILGAGSALLHRAVRRHGNAMAAATLHKLSRLDLIARAVTSVDRDLERAAGTLAGKQPYRRASRFTGPEPSASQKAKWKHAAAAGTTDAMVTPDHLERALPGLQTHAPQISKAILRTLNNGALYLTENRPKPLNKPTLADPLPEPRVTAQDAEAHYDRVKAMEDPAGVLADAIESGQLSAVEMQTIRQNYPELLKDAQNKVLDVLSGPHPPLTTPQIHMLEVLFDGAGDELSDPTVGAVMQRAYNTPAAQPQQIAPSKIKPIEGLADASKTRLQSVRAQHQPGSQ